MKTVETPKTKENVEHQNAIAIAKTIEELIGKDFFTIEQMRKKIVMPTPDKKGKKLSWAEARGYISSITSYGLVEESPAVKGFKIRLDEAFRLNFLSQQIGNRELEIAELKNLINEILSGMAKNEAPVSNSKAKSPKKTAKITKRK